MTRLFSKSCNNDCTSTTKNPRFLSNWEINKWFILINDPVNFLNFTHVFFIRNNQDIINKILGKNSVKHILRPDETEYVNNGSIYDYCSSRTYVHAWKTVLFQVSWYSPFRKYLPLLHCFITGLPFYFHALSILSPQVTANAPI